LGENVLRITQQRDVVHYDYAYIAVRNSAITTARTISDYGTLLGLISEAEIKAGRHALSAIVVIKSGDGANSPGSGFFELEKGLGIYNVDDDTTWSSEVNGLFEYWPKP
jgi:hypothetical protein